MSDTLRSAPGAPKPTGQAQTGVQVGLFEAEPSPRIRLMLVDGHALAYRAHFAMFTTGMRTREGEPTWAVYGFINSLFKALGEYRPACLAVCFDMDRPTFREQRFEAYKAHRKPMPDDLRPQLQTIRSVVSALGVPIYEVPGYEADDVIGTIALKAAAEGYEVEILTGDRDLFQLVRPGVTVLLPQARGSDLERYDEAGVMARMGIRPDQVVDYKGLVGDTSDNIPGVPGVGEKTALGLLAEFGSFENLYAHLDQVSRPKVREKLLEHQDLARQSFDLARIDIAAPVDNLNWKHCELTLPDVVTLSQLLERLEFKSILNNLPRLLSGFTGTTAGPATPTAVGGARGSFAPPEATSATGRPAGPVVALATATAPLPIAGLPPAVAERPLAVRTRVITTTEALDALVAELQVQDIVAFDTETDGLSPLRCGLVGISLAYGGSDACTCEAVYIPIGHHEGGQLPRGQVLSALSEFFASPVPKVAHHAKFDMHVLYSAGVELRGLVDDTLLAAYVSDANRQSNGLKDLAWDLLHYRMTPIKDLIGAGSKQISMDRVPIAECAPYAAADAAVTLELRGRLLDLLASDRHGIYRRVEMPLIDVLCRMERHGVGLDGELLGQLSVQLADRIAALESEARELVGESFNLNSPKQLEVLLFDKLQLRHVRKTKTGRSTDAAVLEELVGEHPVVAKILEFRQLTKLKNTYIDVLPSFVNPRTGRVHTSYNQHIAATGRLSSDQPNLQNIPIRTDLGRRIRKAFVPCTPGNLILSADYSQIELRILAHVARDEAFIAAFEADQDIHTATAAQIFQVAPAEVTPEMRRKAKAVNFGVAYGQSAFGLARALGIPQQEAREFIDAYRQKYAGVYRYTIETVARAHQVGYVETLLGRRRYLPGLRSSNRMERDAAERAAINAPVQGTAADLIKIAMLGVDRALRDAGLATAMVLQVHDELVFEVPPDELEAAQRIVREQMEGAMQLDVPLKVDQHAGPTWQEAK